MNNAFSWSNIMLWLMNLRRFLIFVCWLFWLFCGNVTDAAENVVLVPARLTHKFGVNLQAECGDARECRRRKKGQAGNNYLSYWLIFGTAL